MPTISVFYGIVIQMFWRDHSPPHFHALYAEHEALIELRDFRVIRGSLPRRAMALVLEWGADHRNELNELMEDWNLCSRLQTPKAIEPLNRAKAGASELGDYVTYYLAESYFETGRAAETLSTLADFKKNFPDSLLTRDVDLVYANALLKAGRAQEVPGQLQPRGPPIAHPKCLASLLKRYSRSVSVRSGADKP